MRVGSFVYAPLKRSISSSSGGERLPIFDLDPGLRWSW